MALNIEQIKARLPHRYPFLMIDRVLEQASGKCTVLKNVTINESHFAGHFPDFSVMPAALIAESMAQATAFVGAEEKAGVNGIRGVVTMSNIKVDKPVVPGDQLIIHVQRAKKFGKLNKFTCEAHVEGEKVASGEINIALL